MLSTGFQMSVCPGTACASNVGSMHCIRPFDGVPLAALESQSLIARGSPPDSCSMIVQIWSMSSSVTGIPFCCRILMPSLIHCSTLPGGGPAGGPPLEPRPPPPAAAATSPPPPPLPPLLPPTLGALPPPLIPPVEAICDCAPPGTGTCEYPPPSISC